ncbi:MAG: hypothetical protein CL943_01030 [Candidatus Diapherotrites archaeon]|uniref:Nucleotidyl transferase domain-containing protein n=1 Tax=Candidatus Iainarchaeum sp. TaxID=3101447 RepID=A0A2D6M0B8_9ARCH|nr:hypothetical protein [Candidatus Diapherotrites archaeon]|tara:strand:- start:8877 stop:9638 length:762 start_codon:yes stop_codon:yes gene_type:complete
MKAVVLAAGRGIRLRPLTKDKPKALVELNGKPFLEWVLDALGSAGIKSTALVVGYLGEKIKERLGNNYNGMQLQYLQQETQLGTAKAIGLAKDFVGADSFICTYTDVIADQRIFKELVSEFAVDKGNVFDEAVEKVDRKFDAVIVGRNVRDPWRFGALKISDNKVLDIVEKPMIGQEPSKIINAGIYWFSPKIFEAIEATKKSDRGEFEITDSIKIMAVKGRVGFKLYDGKCIDISSKEDLEEAEELLKQKNK